MLYDRTYTTLPLTLNLSIEQFCAFESFDNNYNETDLIITNSSLKAKKDYNTLNVKLDPLTSV
jgi:hypothetical protein